MKRIAIIGAPGVGKSTLAKQLSKVLQIKIWHMDKLFWQPGWVQISRKELQIKVKAILKDPSWIIDGNYLNTLDMRLQAADTIIFLDYPIWLCLLGVIKRRIIYRDKVRTDITEGCPEQLDYQFIRYLLRFPRDQKGLIYNKLQKLDPSTKVLIFHNRHSLEKYLLDLN